jgi:predicted GNAT family acetyltransferase
MTGGRQSGRPPGDGMPLEVGDAAEVTMVERSVIEVRDNRRELRYEALVDGALLAESRYRLEPGIVVLVHTEVIPSAEGRGVSSRLVEGALEDIRPRGLRVVPICPFVADYVRRHPAYADLVAHDPATSD